MKIEADSPDSYLAQLPENRREAIQKLREAISGNLPEGFTETMNYGMIGYVVPHSLYPNGYHTDPRQPLPFINIASQKNFIALYHMGLYVNNQLLEWLTQEYPKHTGHVHKKRDSHKVLILELEQTKSSLMESQKTIVRNITWKFNKNSPTAVTTVVSATSWLSWWCFF